MLTPGTERRTVLFVGHDAFRAGAQIALLHLARWFSTRGDCDVIIALKRPGELLAEFRAVAPTYVIGTNDHQHGWRPWHGWRAQSVWNRLGRHRIDMVYLNTVAALDVVADVRKRWSCPIVCHVHELEMSVRRFCGVDRLQRTAPAIAAFIAASRVVGTHLERRFGIPADRVHVVYEGIALPDDDAHTPAQSFSPPGLPDQAFVVGGCGTLEWRKGPDVFLQTARLVRRAAPPEIPIHFLWVGGPTRGVEFEQLLHDATRLGVSDIVHFAGAQSAPARYFSRFGVFFLTSREDPFPLACLEAAAAGVPILCFAEAGGMPEFVGSDAGVVVPYLDAHAAAHEILGLARSPERRMRLGRRAASKVRLHHGIEEIGESIAAVLGPHLGARDAAVHGEVRRA
jgi:glycosyltransferase involved in cell wall biosynthesis